MPKPRHESFCLQIKRGGGAPVGAPSVSAPALCVPAFKRAERTGPEERPLRTPSPFGAPPRHSPGVTPAQLRAALPGNLQRLALLQTPLLASSSRSGHSAGEAGSEAARVRFAKPRAGTAPAPPRRSPREAPLGERAIAFLVHRAARIQRIPPRRAIPLNRMIIFSAVCLLCGRDNCDNAAMIRNCSTKLRRIRIFSN